MRPELPRVSRTEVFRNRKQILENPLPFHRKNFDLLGDTFLVDVTFKGPVIFTRDPEIIRHVLQKNHRNYRKSNLQTEDLARYIGKGLLTAEGDHWRTHRRMIQPAFHKEQLRQLIATMDRVIREELRNIGPGEVQDVYPLVSDLAFQVVAQSLFSRPDLRGPMRELQRITEQNQRMLIREMRQPYLGWWFRLSGLKRKQLVLARRGRDILNRIIEERMASSERPGDLLDRLLDARYEDGSPMSRKQLIDEVLILFTAGHETTANALSYVLFLLAAHPGVQDHLREEILQKQQSSYDLFELIKSSDYAQYCIMEAMRLYPPVYVIDRVALEEDEAAGVGLPKGSLVLMSLYELHRYEDFWEAPTDFRPERFESGKAGDHSSYYYPFGAGPRMCIGNNFAMYEMVLFLIRLLPDYELLPTRAELDLNPLISLKPGPVPIHFKRRN